MRVSGGLLGRKRKAQALPSIPSKPRALAPGLSPVLSVSHKPPGGHGAPGEWPVSGLTLPSPHCVSCTIIHSCVHSGHRAQLQGGLVLRRAPGDGGVALDGGAVVSVTIIVCASHPR